MRISLLIQREPFGAILEQTLAAFLETWRGAPHQVHWYAGRPKLAAIRQRGQQPWLCNIYLNAIFTPDADPRLFDPIRREFTHSPVWWRRPAQRAYVELGVSPFTARWLAQAGVGIVPALPNAEQLLIVAGNHKIRLLDYAQDACYGILKRGFPSVFIEREIAARRLAEALGLPVPRLEAVVEDGAWFKERYVGGTPVNRLADERHARQAVQDAASALHRLHEHTMREELLDEYVERLAERVRTLVKDNPLLSDERKQGLLKMVADLVDEVRGQGSGVGGRQEAGGGRRIVTALTHGDFQPANILVNTDGVWLIDWEYSTRRQVGYDALVYALQARSAGLDRRAQMFRAGELSAEMRGLADGLGLNWTSAAQRRIASQLFALEEMELRMWEEIRPQIAAD